MFRRQTFPGVEGSGGGCRHNTLCCARGLERQRGSEEETASTPKAEPPSHVQSRESGKTGLLAWDVLLAPGAWIHSSPICSIFTSRSEKSPQHSRLAESSG